MSKNHIIKPEFVNWAATKFEEYASEYISVGKYQKRLVFCVSVDGKMFKVLFGGKKIYEGPDFDKAATVYHSVV